MRPRCGVRCWAGSWGRRLDQVRLATTPLGLSFSPGKVPSAAEAAVLDPPSRTLPTAPSDRWQPGCLLPPQAPRPTQAASFCSGLRDPQPRGQLPPPDQPAPQPCATPDAAHLQDQRPAAGHRGRPGHPRQRQLFPQHVAMLHQSTGRVSVGSGLPLPPHPSSLIHPRGLHASPFSSSPQGPA